ncbi:MAG: lipid-A-disaccharide synthase N-terminal domain-containing protein [Campylobacterales bacterium]
MSADTIWLIVGFTGQAIFGSRFLIQWIVSEKKKMSVIPMQFWYISLAGSITLLAYAIHKLDPVFILGQSTGFIIYLRNIILIKRNLAQQKLPEDA